MDPSQQGDNLPWTEILDSDDLSWTQLAIALTEAAEKTHSALSIQSASPAASSFMCTQYDGEDEDDELMIQAMQQIEQQMEEQNLRQQSSLSVHSQYYSEDEDDELMIQALQQIEQQMEEQIERPHSSLSVQTGSSLVSARYDSEEEEDDELMLQAMLQVEAQIEAARRRQEKEQYAINIINDFDDQEKKVDEVCRKQVEMEEACQSRQSPRESEEGEEEAVITPQSKVHITEDEENRVCNVNVGNQEKEEQQSEEDVVSINNMPPVEISVDVADVEDVCCESSS
jgi:hypothetical protein